MSCTWKHSQDQCDNKLDKPDKSRKHPTRDRKHRRRWAWVGYLAAGGVELELRIGRRDDPRLGPVGGLAAEHARLAVLARVAEGCVVQHLPDTGTSHRFRDRLRGRIETRLTFEVVAKVTSQT